MQNIFSLSFLLRDQQFGKIRLYTLLSLFFRLLSVLCSFLIIPVTLSYIGKDQYGVWLTITSFTVWLASMDLGLGNGLRNKLAEAIACNNKQLGIEYVSTTYGVFSLILFLLMLVFLIANSFLNWNAILRTTISSYQLTLVIIITVVSFLLRLLLNLAVTIIIALQKVYVESLINFLINLSTIISIYLLPRFFQPSFTTFSISLAIIPIVILLLFNIFLFKISPFSYLKPELRNFKRKHIRALLDVGVQFFLIQFAGIIMFSTDNILITHLFSPADVTEFNIAYRYFSVATLIFTIILTPYWSAFTTAYFKNDVKWIKAAFRKLLSYWIIQVFAVILLIVLSNFVFHFWIGNKISINFLLVACLGVYAIIYNWNNIFAYFINGVSKIRLQLYSCIFAGIINIPISYVFAKFTNFGVASIVIANALCLLISSVWSPFQCYKLVSKKASGIWDK